MIGGKWKEKMDGWMMYGWVMDGRMDGGTVTCSSQVTGRHSYLLRPQCSEYLALSPFPLVFPLSPRAVL